MDIEGIKEILKMVNRSNLDEVEIEKKDFRIKIRKNSAAESVVYSTIPVQQPVAAIPSLAPVAAAPTEAPASTDTAANAPAAEKAAPASNTIEVKSPMIGTFYRSANPDADAFIQVGDIISKGQVLCIIEAMKLFNEIESEVEGKIVKILVDNATPVEYDTPLFLVEPS